MYGGIDKGNTRDHLKKVLPLKLHDVINQAVETPRIKTPKETPKTRSKELVTYSLRTVSNKWFHVDEYPSNRLIRISKIGVKKMIAINENKKVVKLI